MIGAPAAFAVAAASMPLAKRLGDWLGITATPAINTGGTSKIPATGGLSIVAAVLLAAYGAGCITPWLAIGVLGLCLVGAVDDAISLTPGQKFFCQLAIVGATASFGLQNYPFTPWPVANVAVAVFWLTATTNAFNLIDGLDGLAAAVGVVAAGAISVASLILGAPAILALSLIVCGSLLGFLVYNFAPASIIMGDAGALPMGFLLGVLTLEGGRFANNTELAIWVFPVLVMLFPLLDTAIVSVARTATGKAISRHGLDHAHDRLLSLGLTDRQVVATSCLVGLLGAGGAIAVVSLSRGDLVVALPNIALVAAVIALFTIDMTFDDTTPVAAYGTMQGLARLVLSLGYKRRLADAAMDLILIVAAYCTAVALRLDFEVNRQVFNTIVDGLPWIVALTYIALLVTGIYRAIWRHVGIGDVLRFTSGGVLAGAFIVLGSEVLPIRHSGSIAVIYAILLANMLFATRASFVLLRRIINRLATVADRVLVIGAGREGAMAANFVLQTRARSARLIGFADGDHFRAGKLVEGWRVLGTPDEIEKIYRRVPFTEIVLADDELSAECLQRIKEFGRRQKVRVRSFTMQISDIDAISTPAGSEAEVRHAAVPLS
jgi:UDP-GlcNAc:undecaprenyl-phosphate GlcNAc-1-phosphate transferase